MKRTVKKTVSWIAGGSFGLFLIVAISLGWFSDLFAQGKPKLGADKAPVKMMDAAKAINDALVNASEAVKSTVVSISVDVKIDSKSGGNQFPEEFQDFFRFFGPRGNDDGEGSRSRGAGSGVIISKDGYIVTNNHVVEDAVEEGIKVTLDDKTEYKAKLIGKDPLTDLAVIKIDADNLPVAHFGDIEKVRVGEMVIAVGNPLGLNSTVTSGIISAIGRGLAMNRKSSYSVENYIQTDAAINPGNSGGGLFDLNGSLVGINTAIATQTGSYIGYGFAIPIDLVKSVVEDLIDDGKVSRGYIGVAIKPVNEAFRKSLGLDKIEGVVVNSVIKNSPGDKAGIEPEDVILEINGKSVNSPNELQAIVAQHKIGETLKLTIWRDNKKITKNVKLEAKDEDSDQASGDSDASKGESNSNDPVKFDKLGFSISPLSKEQKETFDVENGVFVSNVNRFSEAADRGLFPNGVIIKADRNPVKSTEGLKRLIESKKTGETVLLQVKYKDNNQIVALEIP